MNLNPEFKRNLWLEISPTRLLIMPLVVGLMVILSMIISNNKAMEVLLLIASFLCAALLIGWGSIAAIGSITNEVSERTWDQQRLSALTPWEMAWGKLFGSTAYAWYGGLLCAAVICIAALFVPNTIAYWTLLLAGLIGAIALHCVLMASHLYTLDVHSKKNTGGVIVWLFSIFIFFRFTSMFFMFSNEFLGNNITHKGWWGLTWSYPVQSLLLAILALVLGLLALWRSMSKQLMVRTTPWAWALGIVCVGLIGAGFIENDSLHAIRTTTLLSILTVAILTAYCAIYAESNNLLVWRTVVFHWQNSSKRRFFQALPLWVVSMGLAFILAGLYTVSQIGNETTKETVILNNLLWLGVFHCLRDCGIYLFFAFRNTTKKPLGMTILTLSILGFILPMIFSLNAGQWFEPLYGIKNMLDYQGNSLGIVAWVSMLLHLLIVAALIAWRWSKVPKTI